MQTPNPPTTEAISTDQSTDQATDQPANLLPSLLPIYLPIYEPIYQMERQIDLLDGSDLPGTYAQVVVALRQQLDALLSRVSDLVLSGQRTPEPGRVSLANFLGEVETQAKASFLAEREGACYILVAPSLFAAATTEIPLSPLVLQETLTAFFETARTALHQKKGLALLQIHPQADKGLHLHLSIKAPLFDPEEATDLRQRFLAQVVHHVSGASLLSREASQDLHLPWEGQGAVAQEAHGGRILLCHPRSIETRILAPFLAECGFEVEVVASRALAKEKLASGTYLALLSAEAYVPALADNPLALSPLALPTWLRSDRLVSELLAGQSPDTASTTSSQEQLAAVLAPDGPFQEQETVPEEAIPSEPEPTGDPEDVAEAAPTEAEESATPEPTPQETGIDLSVLSGLRSFQQPGGPNLVQELVSQFLHDLPVRCEAIRQAVDKKDGQQLEQSASALRASSGIVGAFRLSRICAQLETEASGMPPQVSAIVSLFESECALVSDSLRRFSQTQGGLP